MGGNATMAMLKIIEMQRKLRKEFQYKTFNGAMQGAYALLDRLQTIIDTDSNKFCENYGQNEIRDFESKLSNLHYTEKCDVMDVLYRVSSMTPKVSHFEFDENGDNIIK